MLSLRLARGWLGDNPIASTSTDFPDRMSRSTNATNHSRDVSRTMARHSGATDEMGVASTPCRPGRDGAGVTGRCVGTVPTTDARAALCGLTPTAPRTVRRGESSPGTCSLRISVQDQLLPPSLGNPLQGLDSLGIHARRTPHDGSASAPYAVNTQRPARRPPCLASSYHWSSHVAQDQV